ncbi:MAG: DUF485 domain-containing protein [Planctomycetia bacterium]
MAGFDHGAGRPDASEDAATAARNARIGMFLFAVYTAFYAGFVLLNAFRPRVMVDVEIAGVNLATTYGVGLIAFAFLLSIVYGALCWNPVKTGSKTEAAGATEDGE